MTGSNIKYYLMTTASLVALAFISCYFTGLIQLFAGILISVILGSQTVKMHYGFVAASTSITFLIPLVISLLSGAVFTTALLYALLLIIPIILMGLTLGFSANLKLSFNKTVIFLAILYLASTLTGMKILNLAGNPAMNIEAIISQSIDQAMLSLDSVYSDLPEIDELFNTVISAVSSMMLTLSPSLFIIISLAVGYITALIFKSFLARRRVDMSFWPAFYLQRADKSFAILFLIVFFLNSFVPEGMFKDAMTNVILILSCIFFLYGLTFFSWKLRASGVKSPTRKLIFIALIPVCSMLFMLPFFIILIIGLFDGIFDYRSRLSKGEDNK
ncbi:MAG: DUF2232 domain-containing protein [Clostridia bacterium]|nr:DUF2232 domain-containing protein [Clostridia bacterium]